MRLSVGREIGFTTASLEKVRGTAEKSFFNRERTQRTQEDAEERLVHLFKLY